MELKEFNTKLRTSIKHINEAGFKVADIGKLLTGAATSQIARFLKKETDFGIKPISKIAKQAGYSIHIIAIPDNYEHKSELLDELDERTNVFFDELYDGSINCLNIRFEGSLNGNAPRNTVSRKTIDEILDDLTL